MQKRNCPRCGKPMTIGLRWSRSRRRFLRVYNCNDCCKWFHKKFFK